MWTELSDTAILKRLGTRLKAYRIANEMKQQELAAESGVGVSTIAKIESGQAVISFHSTVRLTILRERTCWQWHRTSAYVMPTAS